MHMHQDDPSRLPCVCTSLRKASRAVSRFYDEAFADAGMTVSQFSILRNLAREGESPLSRLAELMVMDRTSLYRALALLDRQGWIAIAQGTSGRTKTAGLTDTGRTAMKAAEPAWEAAQQRFVAMLGAGEWAALRGALEDVVETARRAS